MCVRVFFWIFPPCCSRCPSAWRVGGTGKSAAWLTPCVQAGGCSAACFAFGHRPEPRAEVHRAHQHCSHGQAGDQGRTQRRLAAPQSPRCCSTAGPLQLSLVHGGRDVSRVDASEQSDKYRGFWGPPASDLNSENHKAAAPRLAKFRVRVASLALGGEGQGNARSRLRPCARLPVTAHRADNGGINALQTTSCVGHLGLARQGSCLPAARFVRPVCQHCASLFCTTWPAHAPGGWPVRQEHRL